MELIFKTIHTDVRYGKCKTEIYKKHPSVITYKGYHGNEYIRKGGVTSEHLELVAIVPGYISRDEEREWELLLSEKDSL